MGHAVKDHRTACLVVADNRVEVVVVGRLPSEAQLLLRELLVAGNLFEAVAVCQLTFGVQWLLREPLAAGNLVEVVVGRLLSGVQ